MELPPAALRVVGVAAGQGGLLVTALTWAGCGTGFGVVAIVLLVVAAAAVALGAPSALAYLAVPLWLAWLARRGYQAALDLAGRSLGTVRTPGRLTGWGCSSTERARPSGPGPPAAPGLALSTEPERPFAPRRSAPEPSAASPAFSPLAPVVRTAFPVGTRYGQSS